MQPKNETIPWLDRPIAPFLPGLNKEAIFILFILGLAVFSCLYEIGERVISFDEVNHVVPSYDLYQGKGYHYNPMTHGPLQFHMIALAFFILGDSDTSARLPAALFGIGTIAFALLAYRRFLGRVGALAAGFFLLISPYMLFYSRYARNEIYIAFWAAGLLYAVLAYLESGKARYLYWFTLMNAMHFVDKATAYIFAGEITLFLGLFFIERVLRQKWEKPRYWRDFIYTLLALVGFIGVALVMVVTGKIPSVTGMSASPAFLSDFIPMARIVIPISLLGTLVSFVAAAYFLFKGFGLKRIRNERTFDLILLQVTIVLPLSAAIFIKAAGFDPLNYSNSNLMISGLFILPLAIVALVIGLWWRPRVWLKCMAIFWSIFVVFYSTFFTNGMGIPMGLIAALGYWSTQQVVQRGGQPLYYYLLLQVPTYEFLPAIGTLVAVYLGFRHRLWITSPGQSFQVPETNHPVINGRQSMDSINSEETGNPGIEPIESVIQDFERDVPPKKILSPLTNWFTHVRQEEPPETLLLQPPPTLALLVFWSISNLIVFSMAGERMPWLTIHIALPLILTAGWSVGYLIETTHWNEMNQHRNWLVVLLLVVFLASLMGIITLLLSANPPFQGKTIDQLQTTNVFLSYLGMLILSGYSLIRLLKEWRFADLRRVTLFIVFAFLAVLTIRTAIRAVYLNDDTALEFLVYAHSARGPKIALAQIEDISYRTMGGKDIMVAYDNDVNYPYWWYLRDYPNKVNFSDKPTNELRNYSIVIVGETLFNEVDSILGSDYDKIEYMRLWWPMEDYKNLTWERIASALIDPQVRNAIFQIWFNRNYQPYAYLEMRDNLTLANWQPGLHMRLYIRKDTSSQIWKYGAASATWPALVDPYVSSKISLNADLIIGSSGSEPGQFNAPRQMAFATDGTIYVADSRNNRIQHLSADGKKVIAQWGTFADVSKGSAPGGTFYEPWGIAVGLDGMVYVADTWNNRIEKFTQDGKFVSMWGSFGEATSPVAFWGPRGLAIDSQGRLFVADTGNKRVVVFDGNGEFITQFGSAGSNAGQFDEPVGVTVDINGKVYITDTWNQRVQVMAPDAAGRYTSVLTWAIHGWVGQSLENKPFIAVDGQGHAFVTDPENFRVLEFKTNGEFVRVWGEYGADQKGIGEASGVVVDAQDNVWVSDAVNMRLLRFKVSQ